MKDKSKYLNITKNEIKAKKECLIIINLDEYKNVSEEIVENENNDNELVLNIHGFFEIVFPNDLNSIQFTLPYNVNLYKHNVSAGKNSKELIFKFIPGDTIFTARFKNKNTNIDVLSALFQNRIKYISDDIYELVLSIYNQLSGVTNIDIFNIEIILTQVFAESLNGKLTPLRLTNKKYSKKYAIDFTKSSHNFSNIMGFSYGYTNKYLMTKITNKNKKLDDSYLENIITNKYTKIKENENK